MRNPKIATTGHRQIQEFLRYAVSRFYPYFVQIDALSSPLPVKKLRRISPDRRLSPIAHAAASNHSVQPHVMRFPLHQLAARPVYAASLLWCGLLFHIISEFTLTVKSRTLSFHRRMPRKWLGDDELWLGIAVMQTLWRRIEASKKKM